MSNYIFFINDAEIAEGNQFLQDGKFREAEKCFQSALDNLYRYNGNELYPTLIFLGLKNKIQFCRRNIFDVKELNTHLGCVLYHLQRFDIQMVSDLLQDDITYMEYSKNVFVEKLSIALQEFRQHGDLYLERISDYCDSNMCNHKKVCYTFIGNKSKLYMALIFVLENGLIADIYECTKFKTNRKYLNLQFKIIVDDKNLPF
jgi:hypothetical protein